MKHLLVYCLLPLALGTLSVFMHPEKASWEPPEPGPGEVLLQEVFGWTDPVIWVDAREEQYFELEHIPGAVLLNDASFEVQLPVLLEQWQPGSRIVVYCDTQLCDASHSIAERLRTEIGLPEVWILYGGWSSWKRNG